jgi:hypothetical protein
VEIEMSLEKAIKINLKYLISLLQLVFAVFLFLLTLTWATQHKVSWVILMPIAVIVSGILLSRRLEISVRLGILSACFVSLALFLILIAPNVDQFFNRQLSIVLRNLNSYLVLIAFITVACALFIFLVFGRWIQGPTDRALSREHKQQIEKLSQAHRESE